MAQLVLEICKAFGHWRERRRTRKCPHIIVSRAPNGLRIDSSTTPVGYYHAQCWQCGLVSAQDAFRHDLNMRSQRVSDELGWKWERVE